MNIYLVTRPEGNKAGYDEFRAFIVAAETEEQARYTHPGPGYVWDPKGRFVRPGSTSSNLSEDDWWKYPEWIAPQQAVVTLIGVASPGVEGVLLDDYREG